ncbi:hypothetical protein STCU_05997 [Strigomonas culicis]|uniref:Uncharacterized protein n=1 Tax=Strigomonas culicis TaxID=28005 RepID=S9VUL0_9TRYP|nr:hypothetical protein STCU_05997 [Strigomonas culicis]|eukprot:EPY26950.1 hypothetical protein STCU_05997 [Strigomonas culicis]
MKELLLQQLCKSARVVPQVPFAAHTPQSTLRYSEMDHRSSAFLRGAPTVTTAAGSIVPIRTRPSALRSSVVVLGVFCSVRLPRRAHPADDSWEDDGGANVPQHGKRLRQAEPSGGAVCSNCGDAVPRTEDDLVLKRCRIDTDEAVEAKDAEVQQSQRPSALGKEEEGDGEQRRLYVRVQYDEVLVETLPLEVMRVRHPQVLIDFLLSTALWK